MENTIENTNWQGDSALRLIQLAADALVTYENCAGLSKADACWEGMKLAVKELEEMGGKMPDHNTLRLIGRYNGAGAARLGLQALKNG